MIAAFLSALVRLNAVAAFAIGVVLLLRMLVRRWAGAGAGYALWGAVPIAGMAALLPSGAWVSRPVSPSADIVATYITPASFTAHPSMTAILFGTWTAGVALALASLVLRQARFVASLGRLERTGANRLTTERDGIGPFVIGALRPRIVIPADFERRFAPEERALVLAHEQMHLAHGDTWINAAAAAAQCLCWFNPLVHLAVNRLRVDQEFNCDAAVLSRFPAERRRYGEALLKTQLSSRPLPLGCQWPSANRHPLKERITMLRSPLPSARRRALGLSAVAVIATSIGFAAWAAQAPDFSGAWSVNGDIRSGEQMARAAPVCTFKQSGDGLSGSCEGPNSRGPAVGTISGHHVTWRWTFTPHTKAGLGGSSTFDGAIGDDGVIHGTWTYSGLPGAKGQFMGQRKG